MCTSSALESTLTQPRPSRLLFWEKCTDANCKARSRHWQHVRSEITEWQHAGSVHVCPHASSPEASFKPRHLSRLTFHLPVWRDKQKLSEGSVFIVGHLKKKSLVSQRRGRHLRASDWSWGLESSCTIGWVNTEGDESGIGNLDVVGGVKADLARA